jgi:nucleobase:cation symporter-1, NCS1 family
MDEPYALSPDGAFHYDGGWNRWALIALAAAGALSIGLSSLGTYRVIFDVGDWGWLIGSGAGALTYLSLSRQRRPAFAGGAGE